MKYLLTFYLLALIFFGSCEKKDPNISVIISQRQVPVLTGKQSNEVLMLSVIRNDSIPTTIERIEFSTEGTTDLGDLESASVFYTRKYARFSDKRTYSKIQVTSQNLVFEGTQALEYDTSYFWLSYKLSNEADLFNSVDATCTSLNTNTGNVSIHADSSAKAITQQLGVAVRQHMQDGVHTYRIPGLTTTKKGTLLACYDIRRNTGRDLQGDIDIGISRSTDGGQSWEPMRIALDMGAWGGLPEKYNGVSDACLLADINTGDVYVAGLWMHGVINSEGTWLEGLTEDSAAWNHQWRNRGSQAGYGVKQTSQFLIAKSEDDGINWSDPVNITRMGKKKEEWLYAPAPGHGIVMDDGTLVFPTQGRDSVGGTFSNVTWSKDEGKTWTASKPAYTNTTESMVVQLDDGRLMQNMRDNRNRKNKSETNGRAVAVSKDLGEHWSEHPSSHGALIEPVCMGSLHKHSYIENGQEKSILIFSNPNSKYKRICQTIKISFDNGTTWPEENWLLLDEGRGAGYSCITSIDENTIGILYEGSQAHMTFQKIPLSGLSGKQ